jgi:hypothetical protein
MKKKLTKAWLRKRSPSSNNILQISRSSDWLGVMVRDTGLEYNVNSFIHHRRPFFSLPLCPFFLFMTISSIPEPHSYGALESPQAESALISDEERDILQTVRPGYGTGSIFSTSFNIVNATVGSGILGVPYALHCGGFIGGMAISIFVGFLTAVSLMMMIRAGIRSNIFKFAQLSEQALGRPGFHLLNLFVFIQASGSCISYFISE